MQHISSILVIANRSMQHTAAIRHGREIAKTTGASLQLVLFDFDALIEQTAVMVSPKVMQLARTQFEQQRMQWLASEAAVMAADGIQADCDFVWSPELYEAVIAKCLQLKPDLVIKDAPGKDKDSQDQDYAPNRKLFRYCPAPLLLVKPDSPDLPIEVLAAVDVGAGSDDRAPLNDIILSSAQAMASIGRGHLHLAHSFPFGEPGITSRLELRRLHAQVRDSERERFEAYADRHDIHRDRRHLLDGAPHRMLPELVQKLHAQLLVVGSNYRSSFDRFVLGSTVERLIGYPPCDLLMVRGEGFMSALEKHLDIEDIQTRYGLEQRFSPVGSAQSSMSGLISPTLL